MWFDSSQNAQLFACIPTPGGDVSFWQVLQKSLPIFILWGSGTALGEIPPYAISFASKVAGEKNADMDEIADIREKKDPVSRMQVWMLDFMEYYDFWGIVAMAAWPNAAFDMCGIVCGHLLFPFWKFFGATLIGKGFMKAPMQSICFTMLFFKQAAFDKAVLYAQNVVLGALGLSFDLVSMVDKQREKMENSPGSSVNDASQGGNSFFSLAWNGFMVCVIGFFVVSTIEQLAQDRARRLPAATS